jgi:hypothetical protein
LFARACVSPDGFCPTVRATVHTYTDLTASPPRTHTRDATQLILIIMSDDGSFDEAPATPSSSVRFKCVSLADSQATFSLTSTLETRKFREDLGRKYQAFNDEYSVRVSGHAELTSAPRGREGARREYIRRTRADDDSDSMCSTKPSKLYVRQPCLHSFRSRMATSITSHPSIRSSATMARVLGLSTSAAERRLGFPRWPANFRGQNGM